MKVKNSSVGCPILLAVIVTVLQGGCAVPWTPSWHEAPSGAPSGEPGERLQAARDLYERADNESKVKAAIEAYDEVLEIDPRNIDALTRLSGLHILLGTAYTEDRSDKARRFAEAMSYAELAMYTNPIFKNRVDAGQTPWEAADAITRREGEAAMLWVTALQYRFKECMNIVSKIINVRQLQHGLVIAKQVEAVGPDLGGGVELALAVSYFSLPASMGGDDERGETYMQKAVEKDDQWLVGRWARGKYYEDLSGNDDGVTADLEWVAAADPADFSDPYPWRIHFIEDARRLLTEHTD